MKTCKIHFYVAGGHVESGSYVCVECGRRHWQTDRPVRIWAHKLIGRVVTRSDDDYNEWADLAHGAREQYLQYVATMQGPV